MHALRVMAPHEPCIDVLLAQWKAADVHLNAGATAPELDGFERRFGLSLPPDFRYLYSLTNGIGGTDENMFSLWSLERIVDERWCALGP